MLMFDLKTFKRRKIKVMMILIAFGHMKFIKEILTIIRNKFVKFQKKNSYFLTKTNLMKLSSSIKNTKGITENHFWKKSEA